MKATILSSGGKPPEIAGFGYDSSRIFRCIIPTKSDPRTRPTVGITDKMTSFCWVEIERCKTVLTMYITSSTADIIYGGLPSNGFDSLRDSPLGDSSS